MKFLLLALTLALASHANAQPIEIKLDQKARQYRYTGTLTLRDPFTNDVLGIYPLVSGGMGRGSSPFGKYEVGAFIDSDTNPRWNVHAVGAPDGEVWDERVQDMRTEIQLHRVHSLDGTLGCFGVVADLPAWRVFTSQLRYVIEWLGSVSFEVEGNPDATDQVGDRPGVSARGFQAGMHRVSMRAIRGLSQAHGQRPRLSAKRARNRTGFTRSARLYDSRESSRRENHRGHYAKANVSKHRIRVAGADRRVRRR